MLEAQGARPCVKLNNSTIIGDTNNIKTIRMLEGQLLDYLAGYWKVIFPWSTTHPTFKLSLG